MPAALRSRAVVLVGSLTVIAAVTDVPLGLTSDYWAEHAMAGSIFSGLLLLGVTVFGVEAFLQARAERHWRNVAGIAFKSLGNSAQAVRETLGTLSDSLSPGWEEWAQLGDYTEPACLGRARARLRDNARGVNDAADVQERLEVLLRDDAWVREVLAVTEVLKQRQVAAVGHWATVMLTTDRLARVIDLHAQLSDRLLVMQRPLRTTMRHLPEHTDWRPLAAERWIGVLVESVALQELMMRLEYNPRWQSKEGREQLGPELLGQLERRHEQYAADGFHPVR